MGISRSRKLELSKMKAFVCFAAVLAAASAAPQVLVGHGVAHAVAHPVAVGGQSTHQSVSTAHGEQRTLVQSKALGATHSSVAQADNSKGLSEIQPSIAANRPVPVGHAAVAPLAAHVAHPVAHAVAHAAPVVAHAGHAFAHPVAHHAVHAAPVVAHPVAHAVHAAPVVHHAPVVHAVAHAAPVAGYAAGDLAEVSPYTYNYGVADDYSKAAFGQTESNDGTGVVEGSYQVNLPDGRVQTVTYHANDVDGYVAEVSYAGEAQYPEAVPVAHAVHAAPVVAHAVHAAPVVAHPVAHPVAVAHAAPVVVG